MKKSILSQALICLAAILIALITLLPILWMVLTSFKTEQEIFAFPPTILPARLQLDNYVNTLIGSQYGQYAVNSLVVGISASLLVIALAIASAYAYSKFFTFKFRNASLIVIIIARMVPEIAFIIPLFLLIQSVGLYDTRLGLILVYAAIAFPLATWLLKTFFDDIPISLAEAASIDGATPLEILRKIIIPISGPAIASTFTITFLTVWNPFLIALVFSKSPQSKTLPVAISDLAHTEYGVNWGGLSAVALVTIIPVFIIGLFAQKYLTSGLTAGAEKS